VLTLRRPDHLQPLQPLIIMQMQPPPPPQLPPPRSHTIRLTPPPTLPPTHIILTIRSPRMLRTRCRPRTIQFPTPTRTFSYAPVNGELVARLSVTVTFTQSDSICSSSNQSKAELADASRDCAHSNLTKLPNSHLSPNFIALRSFFLSLSLSLSLSHTINRLFLVIQASSHGHLRVHLQNSSNESSLQFL
jgi:hypothetical protein